MIGRARVTPLAPLAVPVLIGALALLCGCGGNAPEPAVPPALLRLWREGMAGVQVTTAPAPPAAAERVLLDLSTASGQSWFTVAQPSGAGRIPMLPVRLEPGESLPAGVLALVKDVAGRPGEALSLRVQASIPDGDADQPLTVGAVIELRRPFDAAAGLAVEEVAKLVDARNSATHLLEGAWTPQHLELRTDFVVDRLTAQLALVLLVPQGQEAPQVTIEGLQLAARPLADHLRAGGEFPRLQPLDASGAVRVALDRDWREGLLALPDTSYTFELPADRRRRRLDLALGVAPRDAGLEGSVRLRVAVDGLILLDETVQAPARPEQPAWRDTTVELPPGASNLVLSAEGAGIDPPLAVFGHPSVRAQTANERPNVILISLDTLRPDRLGCYGGRSKVSPRIDALAAQGLRFTAAYSTTSYTLPSHASMLTGQFPARHGAVDPHDRLDPACSPFLARMLADAGYATAAFTGGGYVSPTYGFAEGFDRYSDNDPVWALDTLRGRMLLESGEKRNAESASVQLALLRRYAAPSITSWIERQHDGVPYFLFLHTYIAHNYAPDRQRIEQFGLVDEEEREQPFNHQDRERFNDGEPFPEGEEALRESVYRQYMPYYDATIAMADELVGGVLDALERSGQARDTLVIVTSDHGEEFGEHAFFGHGESLYEPVVRVPLVVRLPESLASSLGGARRQPAVFDEPVSQVDFAPWILRLVGLQPDPRMTAPEPFDSTSLDPPSRRTIVLELDTGTNQLSALRDGALKLMQLGRGTARGLTLGQSVLFDIDQDSGELHDLGGTGAPALERQALLEAFHRQAEEARAGCVSHDFPIDPDTEEHLRGLGYGGFGVTPIPGVTPPADEPPPAEQPPADEQLPADDEQPPAGR